MPEKKPPFISVVIPALNEEKYLPRCLTSLTNQSFKHFEVIVSDGGSKDKTVAIAKKFGAKVVVAPGSTVTYARQKGIEKAKGEIIVGADADCKYPANHLGKIASWFKKDKDTIAVGGGGIFEPQPWWMHWGWKVMYYLLDKLYKLTKIAFYIPAFNLSFKKEVFETIGGYNTHLDFGGDELDILERLKKAGKIVFDIDLKSYPSSRRGTVGFFKLFFKHWLIDYYLGYWLAKIFKKPLIRGKPVR